ncbi:hypothetical protein M3193_08320 [Sporosarcina luteola]|uniref:hypothetical protein n=1 Tax=Sporosarcina luteola TaxID=582850 RepID=UPI00203ACB8C|nr:hypothetical protein [Sporosarcina luteola]MCM3744145.1 hypothetical protein [Sporosarcina luteola]
METLLLHIPKVYEKRNLLIRDYISIDHAYLENGNGGGFIAAETFMTLGHDSEAIVVNYQTDEVTFFNGKDSKFINQLLKRKIPFEPLAIQFIMRSNKKNHQSRWK